MNPGQVLHIESDAHYEQVYAHCAATGKILVTDFSGSRCPPCKRIFPVFERLAAKSATDDETRDLFVFCKIDTGECYETAAKHKISAVPTFHVDFRGEKINAMQGAAEEQLRSMIEQTHLYWRSIMQNELQESGNNSHEGDATLQ